MIDIKEAIAKFPIFMIILFLIALAALPVSGFADQMKFVDVNGPGPGGAPYAADSYGGNYYVSPYYGANLTTGQSNILLFCIDFNHDVTFNQQWNATVHAVPDTQAGFNAAASSFQFGNVSTGGNAGDFVSSVATGESVTLTSLNSWQRYQVEGHLFRDEIGLLGPGLQSTDPAFSRDRAVYQYAVWEAFLENGLAPAFNASFNQITAIDHNFAADVTTVLDDALAHFSVNDLAGWDVVSPNPANSPSGVQEFLTPSPAPEPASIILLGTVMLLVFTKLRRRAH